MPHVTKINRYQANTKYVLVRITILANYALLCIPVFLKREETAKKPDKLKIYVGFSRTRCMEDQQLVRFFSRLLTAIQRLSPFGSADRGVTPREKNAHPCVPHEWAWAVHSYQSYVARAPILPIHPGVIVSFFCQPHVSFLKK